jgi:hypothetical protein
MYNFFSYEAMFHPFDTVNKQSVHIWNSVHSHPNAEVAHYLLRSKFLCSFEDRGRLTLSFLLCRRWTNNIIGMACWKYCMRRWSPSCGRTFHQDGTISHNHSDLRVFLDEQLPEVWTGREDPIPWTLRSPDLSQLDSFFWIFWILLLIDTPCCYRTWSFQRVAIKTRLQTLSWVSRLQRMIKVSRRFGYYSAPQGFRAMVQCNYGSWGSYCRNVISVHTTSTTLMTGCAILPLGIKLMRWCACPAPAAAMLSAPTRHDMTPCYADHSS